MADNQAENEPGQEPNDDDALGGGREQDDQHADDGVSPEIRRLRAEAKRLRLERNELRDKTKAYEDRDKTEEQRRRDELDAATSRAAAAEQRALKFEVAAELGLPPSIASRLQGDTREALAADAKALAKEFGIDAASGGGQPPNFSSGVRRPVQRPKTMNEILLRASGR